jgi:glucose-6-phosphate isomerase
MRIKCSPLELEWNEKECRLYEGGKEFYGEPRTIGDMHSLLYDGEFAQKADKKVVGYYMCRGVCRERDERLWKENGLRFDITVFPKLMLGREWNKTFGHYHSVPAGSKHAFPELYEVLKGKVHSLQQKRGAEGKIVDAIMVEAGEGEKVLVQPDYGHFSINPSRDFLFLANIQSLESSSDYKPVEEKHGAAYYETLRGIVENRNYERIPPLKKIPAASRAENKAFARKSSIYGLFVENPRAFLFLTGPDECVKWVERR